MLVTGKFAVLSGPAVDQGLPAKTRKMRWRKVAFSHSIRINACAWVKDDARRQGLTISIRVACHFLKHPIYRANTGVHSLFRLVPKQCMKATAPMCGAALSTFDAAWTVRLQALRDDPHDGAHAVLPVAVLKTCATWHAWWERLAAHNGHPVQLLACSSSQKAKTQKMELLTVRVLFANYFYWIYGVF